MACIYDPIAPTARWERDWRIHRTQQLASCQQQCQTAKTLSQTRQNVRTETQGYPLTSTCLLWRTRTHTHKREHVQIFICTHASNIQRKRKSGIHY